MNYFSCYVLYISIDVFVTFSVHSDHIHPYCLLLSLSHSCWFPLASNYLLFYCSTFMLLPSSFQPSWSMNSTPVATHLWKMSLPQSETTNCLEILKEEWGLISPSQSTTWCLWYQTWASNCSCCDLTISQWYSCLFSTLSPNSYVLFTLISWTLEGVVELPHLGISIQESFILITLTCYESVQWTLHIAKGSMNVWA